MWRLGGAAAVALALAVPAAAPPDLLTLRVRRGTADPVSLSMIATPPAIVVFWARYCPPCRAEVPVLARASARWHDGGLRVVGVALGFTDAEAVARAVRDWEIPYDVVWAAPDQDGLVDRLAPAGLPATFLVGGGQVARHDRFLSDADLDRLVPNLFGTGPLAPPRSP